MATPADFMYEPSYPPTIPASMTIQEYRRSRARGERPRRGRHVLAATVAVVVVVALAALLPTAPASAASLPAGSTAILSGPSSLFGALPAPVGGSTAPSESVSRDGRFGAATASRWWPPTARRPSGRP